jgi:hypothetical protein
MDAFLAETVVRRKFDFHRNNLSDGWRRDPHRIAAPGHQDAAPADVFGVHGRSHPDCGRSDVAPQLDVDTRALTPVDVFHFIPRHAEFRSPNAPLSIQQMGYSGVFAKVITEITGPPILEMSAY